MKTSNPAVLNKQLEAMGAEMRFDIGSRYNYSAVDLATPEQLARHCCQRNLETGSPRECIAACHRYVVSQIKPVSAS